MPGAPDETRVRVHGTAIALGESAALIRGPSGSGKSDLALRCLAVAAPGLLRGDVRLVSDDQVELVRVGDEIEMRPPAPIAGRLEVRGLGLVTLPHSTSTRLRLVVDLVHPGGYSRLPEAQHRVPLLDLAIPQVRLAPFEASAALKLLLALQSVASGGLEPPI